MNISTELHAYIEKQIKIQRILIKFLVVILLISTGFLLSVYCDRGDPLNAKYVLKECRLKLEALEKFDSKTDSEKELKDLAENSLIVVMFLTNLSFVTGFYLLSLLGLGFPLCVLINSIDRLNFLKKIKRLASLK